MAPIHMITCSGRPSVHKCAMFLCLFPPFDLIQFNFDLIFVPSHTFGMRAINSIICALSKYNVLPIPAHEFEPQPPKSAFTLRQSTNSVWRPKPLVRLPLLLYFLFKNHRALNLTSTPTDLQRSDWKLYKKTRRPAWKTRAIRLQHAMRENIRKKKSIINFAPRHFRRRPRYEHALWVAINIVEQISNEVTSIAVA